MSIVKRAMPIVKWVALPLAFWIGWILAMLFWTELRPRSQTAMQHRVDLLEQDVGYLQERVVKLEDVLVEVLAVQTASPAKGVETKPAAVATKPPEELPVSVAVPQDPPVQARPAKRKSVVRRPASQGSEYPLMKPPYPWTGWENPAPQQQ